MKFEKKFLLEELEEKLSLKDKILLHLFKNYTGKIYIIGIIKGFNSNY